MVNYKSPEEIELIRHNCLMVCETLALVAEHLRPGVTGETLDQLAEEFILDHDAKPGFKGYDGFPSTLCISINEAVVHGIPNGKAIKEGDIVSIDCGVYKNGFYGDAAYTFAIGDIKSEVMDLLVATKQSLYLGIDKAVVGNRIGDIGFTIQNYIERQHNFSVVRELVGHGLGRELHEKPQVPNFGRRKSGIKIKPGLVIAIEPMVNLGKKHVVQLKDGWTVRTKDFSPSAHYEHSIATRKGKPDILSDHVIIEEAIKKNDNLVEISVKS